MSRLLKILSKEQFEDESLIAKLRRDYTADTSEKTRAEFEAACETFRSVCREIEEVTGISGFKGGFEEMVEFQESEVASTQNGLVLAIRWSAADKLCTYLANKMKIGQPEWWKICWGINESEESAS